MGESKPKSRSWNYKAPKNTNGYDIPADFASRMRGQIFIVGKREGVRILRAAYQTEGNPLGAPGRDSRSRWENGIGTFRRWPWKAGNVSLLDFRKPMEWNLFVAGIRYPARRLALYQWKHQEKFDLTYQEIVNREKPGWRLSSMRPSTVHWCFGFILPVGKAGESPPIFGLPWDSQRVNGWFIITPFNIRRACPSFQSASCRTLILLCL
jgi:hypothetical protein